MTDTPSLREVIERCEELGRGDGPGATTFQAWGAALRAHLEEDEARERIHAALEVEYRAMARRLRNPPTDDARLNLMAAIDAMEGVPLDFRLHKSLRELRAGLIGETP